jgi:acetyl/propionyl-CoA carboxylase alpha subunit
VIKTARVGIKTVAVYSDADARAVRGHGRRGRAYRPGPCRVVPDP